MTSSTAVVEGSEHIPETGAFILAPVHRSNIDTPVLCQVTGRRVRYLGSLLLRDDEVVLCLYAGTRDAVDEAARRAELPFERILETARSPWAAHHDDRRGTDR